MSGAVVSALLLNFLMVTSSGHVITINSPNPQPGGNFGATMDSSNGLLLVGAPDQLVNGLGDAGIAYLYDVRTGSLVRTLASPDSQAAGFFGGSVEIADNTLIIGAAGETVPGIFAAGRVYVFNATTGALEQTLTISNSTSFVFGENIEEANGLLAIGSNDMVRGIPEAGRVYIYNATTYSLIRTLVSPNAQLGGQFGTGLEVADDLIVVGANLERVGGVPDVGRAYVFNATTGSLISFIVPPDTNTGFFGGGHPVLAEGRVYIGAFANVNGIPRAGAVYIFDATTGVLEMTLTSPNAERFGLFGSAVTVTKNRLIVGAFGETVDGIRAAGRVYIFNTNTGSLTTTLVDPSVQGLFGSTFGSSVQSSNGRVFVGAPSETVARQLFVGAVIIFSGPVGHGQSGSDQN